MATKVISQFKGGGCVDLGGKTQCQVCEKFGRIARNCRHQFDAQYNEITTTNNSAKSNPTSSPSERALKDSSTPISTLMAFPSSLV